MSNEIPLKEKIDEALRTIYDPELPCNIVELGLVYDVRIKDDNVVFVTMTLTAPACPVAGDIVLQVQETVKAVEGVTDAHVQLTFDPPWTKDMMTEEAQLQLGML